MPARLFIEATPEAAPQAARQLIVPIGTWQHPKYGPLQVTPERAARFVSNFRAGVRAQDGGKLPFTMHHQDSLGAAGWITGLDLDARGVWASVEWTPLGRAAIQDKTYPYVSPEWDDEWLDPETGRTHRDVLAGASLVVRPLFKRLPEVTLCERTRPTVLCCDPDHPEDDMPPDETAPTPTAPTAEAPAAAIPQPLAAEAVPEARQPSLTEPPATQQFSEFQALETEVRRLQFAERRRAFADELAALTFGERGRLAPVSRDALADALAELEPDQAKRIGEAIGTLRFYEPGEAGLATTASAPRALTAEEQLVARQLGLSEEDMR